MRKCIDCRECHWKCDNDSEALHDGSLCGSSQWLFRWSSGLSLVLSELFTSYRPRGGFSPCICTIAISVFPPSQLSFMWTVEAPRLIVFSDVLLFSYYRYCFISLCEDILLRNGLPVDSRHSRSGKGEEQLKDSVLPKLWDDFWTSFGMTVGGKDFEQIVGYLMSFRSLQIPLPRKTIELCWLVFLILAVTSKK